MSDDELKKILEKKLNEMLKKKGKSEVEIEVELDKHELENALSKNKIVVVDFWAEWCGPCRIYSRIFKAVAEKLMGKAFFGRINVDRNPELADRYRIYAIPTTIIFVNGNPVDVIVGLINEEELMKKIEKHL